MYISKYQKTELNDPLQRFSFKYKAKWVGRKSEDEKQKYNPSPANGVTQGLVCQGKKNNPLRTEQTD